ncbi:hypothetical protein J7T55_003010 [Diaporthe amygdali]|uniref:uncharacterized protein n=1 Tax=Phomopsis amygdali TaxID=1214568 RepID=UPI0022FE26A3|nr:uncharacterized protein J7T55_003010 [Diaporthe amygdali]KAJ0122497.1 hypothetical protein J7T55_003010 [Diaporthe amygdali]
MSPTIGKKKLFQARRKLPSKGNHGSTLSDTSWESYVSDGTSNEDASPYVSDVSSGENTEAKLGDQMSEVSRVVEDEDEDGEDCEFHIYESKYDTRGEQILLRVGAKSQFNVEKNRSHRACLVLTRYYFRQSRGFYSNLKVQSKHIIKALKDVIGSYPGEDFDTATVIISVPPKCLFHYRRELKAYAEKSDDTKIKDHVSLCLKYVEKTMAEEIRIFEEGIQDPFALQLDLTRLWLIFKPGCLIYENHDGIDIVSKLQTITENDDDDDETGLIGWHVWTERVLYNGEAFGHIEKYSWIDKFEGRQAVKHFTVFPLLFHPEADRIQHLAEQRGRKYLSFCGVHYCLYNGLARFQESSTFYNSGANKVHVTHRIILDPKAYRHFKDSSWDDFVQGTKIPVKDPPELSIEQLMICTHEIRGYALESKKWGIFNIECVQDMQFNSKAFQGLMFEENKKRLIHSLVSQHGMESDDFDDLVKGKGKGLIFLLYGPPGVGKTLTAESIADLTKRPLFTINSGDVIGKRNAEEALTSTLRLATSWNAVVLLDEADVFMQQRNLATPFANELVAGTGPTPATFVCLLAHSL